MASSPVIRQLLLATSALLPLAVPQGAQAQSPNAMPAGGQVSAGQAAISRSGTRTQVTQGSDRAVIDWQGFDVGRNASVNFTQPNAGSWTLNRVNTPDPSRIAGQITANGGVAIVNPSGVVFSQGSQVNVGSLIATTSNVTNQNFMAGRMQFDGRGNPGARVENHGTITVAQRGLAALVAPGVSNSGTIRARLGTAILAGAETFNLDLAGDGLVSIDVTEAVRRAPGGGVAVVTNSGLVEAHGGQVVLTANAASGLVEDVVLNTGQLWADAVGARTGQVTLSGTGGNVNVAAGRVTARGGAVSVTAHDASVQVGAAARVSTSSRRGGGTVQLGSADTSAVRVQGRVSARGRGATARGGTIAAQARDGVVVASTGRLDASGGAGGGTVLAGSTGVGRAQAMARESRVEQGGVIRADATVRGTGGTVVVNSTEATTMRGRISARGGAAGGDGGFVEVSGQRGLTLDLSGIDLGARSGRPGTLLLDPTSIVIREDGTDAAGDVAATDGAGELVIRGSSLANLTGNLVLAATDGILVVNGFTNSSLSGLTLMTTTPVNAATGIIIGDAITLTGGTLTLTATSAPIAINAALSATAITLNATGDITGAGGLTAGSLTVRGGDGGAGSRAASVLLTGSHSLGSIDIRVNNTPLAFSQAGSFSVTQADAGSGEVFLRSDGTISGGGIVGSSLSVGGFSGTAAQSLTLLTGNAVSGAVDIQSIGDIAFGQAGAIQVARANAGTGALTLRSDGTVTGSNLVGSSLAVSGFSGARSGAVDLSAGNAITGAVSLQAAGNLTFVQDGNILLSLADAGSGAVVLRSNGSVSGTGAVGASLAVQAAAIDLSGNAVTGFIDLLAGGAVSFAQAGGLNIARAAGGGAVTLRSDGDVQGSGISGTSLTIGGATGLRAGALTLVSGNAISGAIDILTSGATAFTQSAALNLARLDAGAGAVTLRSDGTITGGGVAGSSLTIAGAGFLPAAVNLAGNAVTGAVDIQAVAGISFAQAGSLHVTRAASFLGGAIALGSDGAITGGGLAGSSLTVRGATGDRAGSLALTSGNAVSGSLDLMTSGAMSFRQAGSLVIGRADAGTGAVDLRSDGSVTGSGVVGSSLSVGGFGGARAGLISLGGNAVTGDVGLAGTGSITYSQTGGFHLAWADAGLGTVALRSDGIITGGGAVATTLLVGGVSSTRAGGLDLSGSGNAVGLLNALTSGDLGFSQNGTLLVAPGSGSSAGNVSLTSLAGAIGLDASLSAGDGKTLSLTSDHITLSESLIALGGTVELRRATPGDIVIGTTGGDTTLPPLTLASIITADRLVITTAGSVVVSSNITAPATLELAGSAGVTINAGVTISSLAPGLLVDASTGNLVNNGIIRGSASAGGRLRNAGTIDGDATSVLQLTNLAGATIGGSAISTTDALVNSGNIDGFASAATSLSNTFRIGGNATSAGLLTNSELGRIGGDATSTGGDIINSAMIVGAANAALDLTNSGSIGGNAVAGGSLGNQPGGLIGGGATATAGALLNAGTVIGRATAGTTLTNSAWIGMAATSDGLLTNSGTVVGDATSTGGGLTSSGTIGGAAMAVGALENSGGIGNGATSAGLLTNLAGGIITGAASSTAGALQNGGTISGTATAFTTLVNTGTITGAATSGAELTNGGTIGGMATSGAALTNAGRIDGAATAATTLDNSGRIGGGATSAARLDNRVAGMITGDATSTADAIGNAGGIGGAAVAATTLTNSGSIGLTAEASGLVTNSGSIGGTATSTAAGIANTGTIDGVATAQTTLTNSGRIGADARSRDLLSNQAGGEILGDAVSSGGAIGNAGAIRGLASAATSLANTGSIGGDATAGGMLINRAGGIIGGSAISSADALENGGRIGATARARDDLTNLASGMIIGGASSVAGALANAGAIRGSVVAATTLTNSGSIALSAQSAGLLINSGLIGHTATSTGGALVNTGSIGLSAAAAGQITNGGSIGGDAVSGASVLNSGRIAGTVTAEGSVSNLAGGLINGAVLVARTGGVTNQGTIDTAGSLVISAARDILLNGPTLAVGSMLLNTDGAVQGNGRLAATLLSVRGMAGGSRRADSLDLSAPGSQVGSLDILVDGPLGFGQGASFRIVAADAGAGAISFRSDGSVTGAGSVIGRGLTVAGYSSQAAAGLSLTGGSNAVGTLDAQVNGALEFRDMGPLVLRRATSAADSVSITAGGDIRAIGPVTAGKDLALRSDGGSLLLVAGAGVSAGQDAFLEAPGDVIQSGGGLVAARSLYITAGRDALQTGGATFAGSLGNAERGVSAGRDFLWNGGSFAAASIHDVQAGGELGLSVTAGSTLVQGRILSSGDLAIAVAAGSLGLDAAVVRTNGNLLLSASQGVSARGSTLSAGGTAAVTATSGDVSFDLSTLQSNGALAIRAGGGFSALKGGFSTYDRLTVEAGGSGRVDQVSMSASTAPAGSASAFRPLRIAVGGSLDVNRSQVVGERIELVSGGRMTTAGSEFRVGTGLLLSARGGIGQAGEAETQVVALADGRLPLTIMDTRSGVFLSRLPVALTPATADSPGRPFDDQPWQLLGARKGELLFGLADGAPALPTNALAGDIFLNLSAEPSPVFLLLNGATASGNLEAGRLGVFGVRGTELPGGRAVDLTGTLNGFGGVSAARFGSVSAVAVGVPPTGVQFYRFNNCTLTSVNCVTPIIFRIPVIPVVNSVVLNSELGTVDDPDVMLTNVADQDY